MQPGGGAGGASLLDDIQGDALVRLGGGCAEEGPHGPRRTALATDDFAEVFRRHGELQHGAVFFGDFVHADLLRVVHQRLGDVFDEFFHTVHVWDGLQ